MRGRPEGQAMRTSHVVCAVAMGWMLVACSKEEPAKATETTPSKTAAKKEAAPAPPKPAEVKTAEVKPAAPGALGNNGLPVDIPATRSKVPTIPEWDAVTKEITVARSTPLGCETKMLREWLRVSCRGKNKEGGEPTGADTKSGNGAEAFTFAKGGVASVVVPVLRGKKYEALFSWSNKKQLLVVDWANGAPSPTIAFTDP
jgi:hypothetical protein